MASKQRKPKKLMRKPMKAKRRPKVERKAKVRRPKIDDAIRAIFAVRGRPVLVAQACKVSRQAIDDWSKVPPQHVVTVATIIKMTPQEIRPDVFREPT